VRYLLALLIVISAINNASACDWCGCASGSSGIGILPGIKKSFVAVRTSANYSTAYNEHSATTEEAKAKPHSAEESYTTELWARYNIKDRVQLFAFLPYVVNMKTEESIFEKNHGIGDAVVMANVVLFNTSDSIAKKVKHHVMAGGGVKLPTGKFGKLSPNGLLIPNMQTGTGTVDFLLNSIYTLRYSNWGVQADAAYRVNLNNKEFAYRFGNRTNAGLRAYYWHAMNNVMLMPFGGLLFEHADKDVKRSKVRDKTGGEGLYSSLGMQAFFWKMGVSANWSQPIYNNYGNGYIAQHARWNAQVQFFF
jgi:hypothetical protein